MPDGSPRGTKRGAEHLDEPVITRRIRALDADVINKIAAGEIIVAPVHALKELMENAIDAGATSLEIVVKEGGLKLLQITDNGSGIDVSSALFYRHRLVESVVCAHADMLQKADLPILCERFTTSKLEKFEDLASIETYGFRGEALASISHIAHLTVTTKTVDSDVAWRAHYDGGKLVPAKPGQSADPRPMAGRQGTQLTVEDLFYNVPTRRRAFRSAADEYNKIVDMVSRYAVHCEHVAFSCKKHGDSSTSIAVQASASSTDRIRQIYGSAVANELIDFAVEDARWGFKSQGRASNANYSMKKTTFLLFINHRCVDSSNMRKALEQTYSTFLPKNGHPFIYLSLEIDPKRVDVNVHPTKREVNFLNEDEITQAICEHIRSKLAAVDTSRTFTTQTLLPAGGAWTTPGLEAGLSTPSAASRSGGNNPRRTPGRPYENNLVRTDTNMRKITGMLLPATQHGNKVSSTQAGATAAADGRNAPEPIEYEHIDRDMVPCKLVSVHELRAAVREEMHNELTETFASHTFVGVVDECRRLAAIQGGVKLFLVDYARICAEYFYQVGLTDFGNFGVIKFSPPLELRALLTNAAEYEKAKITAGQDDEDDEDSDFEVADVVEMVEAKLVESREMLQEYFSLEISPAGELISIPLLVKGYTPPLVKLPNFLLRLGPKVNWTSEKECFDTFLRELATFYVPEQLPPAPLPVVRNSSVGEGEGGTAADERADEAMLDADESAEAPEMVARRTHVRWALEHVLFPAFKARLVATNALLQGGILEVANLKGLYRVFERC
jgi:DNA mismatch repair protein MLH1